MGWGGGLTFPLGVSVKTPPGVCLAHGPLWGSTLGTGDPGPRRARARAAAELWGVRGEIRVPWVLAGSPQAHRGGWDPGCGLLPLQPSRPQEARRYRPALPPRAVPPARPGTVLQGLPAQSPSEPAREVGLGDGGSSHCPRADPADASCGHFLDSHLGAPLGHDKYPRQLGAGAGGVPTFTGAPPQKLPQKRGSRVAAPAPPVRGGMQETPLEWARVQFCAGDVQTGSRRLWSLRHGGCPAPASSQSPCPSRQGPPEL